MPDQTTPAHGPREEGTTGTDTVETDTVEELRERLDLLLNDPLDIWAANMHSGGVRYVADFESTLSWRVTRPLRAARTFQIRVGQLGFPGAVGHAVRYARRHFAGRSQ